MAYDIILSMPNFLSNYDAWEKGYMIAGAVLTVGSVGMLFVNPWAAGCCVLGGGYLNRMAVARRWKRQALTLSK